MFKVSVQQHFDAAHYLRGYMGKCENLHGHRYQVVVTLAVKELDRIGLAYDFVALKRHLTEVLERFDHICLNDVPPFDRINPSSENIATIICEELQKRQLPISSIQVCESPDCCVTYIPDETG